MPDEIGAAVLALEGCRPAAARLRTQIARLPGPESAIQALEAYA
jgi:hypothetical protein